MSLLSFISLSLHLSLSLSLVCRVSLRFFRPITWNFSRFFSGNRRFSLPFLDLDECVHGSHDCLQSLASCSNTDGSFKCSCNDGYIGDGKTYCQPKSKDVFIISMSGFISLQGSHHGNHQGIAKCKLQRLKWADFDNDDHGDGVDIRIISLIMKMMITTIIIRCKCFFLCIGRQPATWPANNCLQIMVCSCAMSFNCFWLQILFCSCVNETTLFSFLRSLLRENGRSLRFPKIFLKKQTRWSNDKTIIELSYRKISWFVSVSQINYLQLVTTDKSRYFAQPRPIIANYWYEQEVKLVMTVM